MPREVHGVVKDADDLYGASPPSENDEMPWIGDTLAGALMLTTMPEVINEDIVGQIRPRLNTHPFRIKAQIFISELDQPPISAPRLAAELALTPSEQFNDIPARPRRNGKAHQA
jgi:hypothetical protein